GGGPGLDPAARDLVPRTAARRLRAERRPDPEQPDGDVPGDESIDRPPSPPMTDYDLPPETEEFRKVVRSFAEEVVRPVAEHYDARAEFPLAVVRQMGDVG